MTRNILLLLAACTEYDIKPTKDPNDGSDTAVDTGDPRDTGITVVDACDEFEQPDPVEVELATECDVALSEGSFSPVIEWKYGSGPFCGPPAVGQIVDTNGSGAIDSEDMPIILLYQSNNVMAIYGDGSGVAWRTSGAAYGQDGGFAIGDLDDDGWPEVVTASSSTVCVLEGSSGAERWCLGGLSSSLDPYGYSYPAIADMDGVGNPLITVGNAIIKGDGTLLGRGDHGIGAAPYEGTGAFGSYGALSVPIDLDGDGQMELVTGNAAYDNRGNTLWYNGEIDGIVAVADFDGDGEGEIVKTSGYYVYGMESDGSVDWGPKSYTTYGTNIGAPAIDDLDGDGTPEFVFAAQNSLVAMSWGGAVKWTATIDDMSGAAGPVLFDFEMDGYPEVLYADESTIRFFSGLDGSVKYRSGDHISYTILETPIVADVDNDDQVEIVLGHCNGNASIGALTVYGDADESWPPGRKIWNQHAYSITNVDDLGGIPTDNTPNWPEYNSFRSGDPGQPPGEYYDLRPQILDVCEDDCESGTLHVAARLLNASNLNVPAGVSVSLRAGVGGPIIATTLTTAAIQSGKSGEIVTFEVSAESFAGKKPVVTADEDASGSSAIYECDEDNNVENWSETVCD